MKKLLLLVLLLAVPAMAKLTPGPGINQPFMQPLKSVQVTTTDATATIVAADNVLRTALYYAVCRAAYVAGTTEKHGGFIRSGLFYPSAGPVANQEGSTTSIMATSTGGAMAVAFAVVNDQVQLKVTGIASTTIKWNCDWSKL